MADSKLFFNDYIYDGSAQEKVFQALDNNDFGTGHTIVRIDGQQYTVSNSEEYTDIIDSYSGKKVDITMSLNTFSFTNRQEDYCFDIRAIYVDVDWHEIAPEKREDILNTVITKLSHAVEIGEILLPTIAMFTGRGLSLIYSLDRSICYAGNTENLKKKYKVVYSKILSCFKNLLSVTGVNIDMSVTDISRLFRLPDTFNTAAGSYCKMFDHKIMHYSLTELDKGFRVECTGSDKTNSKQNKEKLLKSKPIYTDAEDYELLTGRCRFIENYVLHMQENGFYEGYRELACHLYYTFNYSINPDIAKDAVRDFNNIFVKPLTEGEIRRSFSRKKYKYRNETMCEKLGVSLEDAYALGLSRPRRRKSISAKKTQTQKELILIDSLMTKQIKENGKVNKKKLLNEINKIYSMSRATLFRKIDELSYMKKVSQKTAPYDVIPLLSSNENILAYPKQNINHPPIKDETSMNSTKDSYPPIKCETSKDAVKKPVTSENSTFSPQGRSLACKAAKINNIPSRNEDSVAISNALDPLGSKTAFQSRLSDKPTSLKCNINSPSATGSNLLYSDFGLNDDFQKKFELRQKLLSNSEDLGTSSTLEDIFLLKSSNPYKIDNLLFNLGLSGKNDLKQFFKELSAHCPDYPTIEGLEKAVFNVYGMTLCTLDLQRKTRERNTENWHWRQTNQETWDFIKKIRHSYDDINYSLLKACQLYSEINYTCKTSLNNKTDFYYVSFVDGYIWHADYVKKTLLYHTTVDQLQTIAEKFDCEYMQPEEFLLNLALLQDEYVDKEALEEYYAQTILTYEEELAVA